MFLISNSYFVVYNADTDPERFRNLYWKSAPKETHQRLSSLNFNLYKKCFWSASVRRNDEAAGFTKM
jgi:hypothetical protein